MYLFRPGTPSADRQSGLWLSAGQYGDPDDLLVEVWSSHVAQKAYLEKRSRPDRFIKYIYQSTTKIYDWWLGFWIIRPSGLIDWRGCSVIGEIQKFQ